MKPVDTYTCTPKVKKPDPVKVKCKDYPKLSWKCRDYKQFCNTKYMKEVCPGTCRSCNKERKQCRDFPGLEWTCKKYDPYCFLPYMKSLCPQTCNTCGKKNGMGFVKPTNEEKIPLVKPTEWCNPKNDPWCSNYL